MIFQWTIFDVQKTTTKKVSLKQCIKFTQKKKKKNIEFYE